MPRGVTALAGGPALWRERCVATATTAAATLLATGGLAASSTTSGLGAPPAAGVAGGPAALLDKSQVETLSKATMTDSVMKARR